MQAKRKKLTKVEETYNSNTIHGGPGSNPDWMYEDNDGNVWFAQNQKHYELMLEHYKEEKREMEWMANRRPFASIPSDAAIKPEWTHPDETLLGTYQRAGGSPSQVMESREKEATSTGLRRSDLGWLGGPAAGLAYALGVAPEVAGQMFGGSARTLAKLIPHPTAKAFYVGAGLGSGLGRAYQMAATTMTGLDPPPMRELAGEIASSVAEGFGFEIAGAAVVKGAGKLAQKYIKFWPFRGVTPSQNAQRAMDNIDKALGSDTQLGLTPAGQSPSVFWQIWENMGLGGFGGQGRLSTFMKNTQQSFQDSMLAFMNKYELIPKDELGESLQDTIWKQLKNNADFKTGVSTRRVLLKRARDRNLLVPIKPNREVWIRPTRKRPASKDGKRPAVEAVEGRWQAPSDKYPQGQIPLEESIHTRSKLLRSIQEETDPLLKNEANAYLNELNDSINYALNKANLKGLWTASNEAFSRGYEKQLPKFLQPAVYRASKYPPEQFLDKMSGGDRRTFAKLLKKAIGDTQEFKNYQISVIESVLHRAKKDAWVLDAPRPIVQGEKGLLSLEPMDPKFGKDFLTELLGEDTFKLLNEYFFTMRELQKGTSSNVMKVGMALMQPSALVVSAGAILSGFGSGISVVSGAVIVGPWAYARLATTAVGRKLIREGMKLPAHSNRVPAIAARMSHVLTKSRVQEQELDNNYQDPEPMGTVPSIVESVPPRRSRARARR